MPIYVELPIRATSSPAPSSSSPTSEVATMTTSSLASTGPNTVTVTSGGTILLTNSSPAASSPCGAASSTTMTGAGTLTITTAVGTDLGGLKTGVCMTSVAAGPDHSDEDDDDDDFLSSDESAYEDDGELMSSAVAGDEVTAQLAAAGPVGMAAAAAIASSRKRKRPHYFETNPSIRKRQQTRLIRRLRQTIEEFATRVGQQAIVLMATPGKPAQNNFRVFGAKPLEDVIKNLSGMIMADLESALAQHAPPPVQEDPTRHELPPLVIDGIPTPVEKMTQAQLRAFIPLMLKYSTGRGKPGWGKEQTRPPWWPKDLPWANVRMDARTEEQKQKVSWTHALRQIVINCYKFHGREDLLPAFNEEDAAAIAGDPDEDDGGGLVPGEEDEEDEDGMVHTRHVINASANRNRTGASMVMARPRVPQIGLPSPPKQLKLASRAPVVTSSVPDDGPHHQVHYTPTVVQTISNADGTVSIIQVDPTNPIIQLPDGTTAQVQGLIPSMDGATLSTLTEATHQQASSSEDAVMSGGTVQLTGDPSEGQHHIIITGEDGQSMITVPVPVSMYQTVMAQMGHVNGQALQVMTPLMAMPKMEPLEVSSNGQVIKSENMMDTGEVPAHHQIHVVCSSTSNGSNGNQGHHQPIVVLAAADDEGQLPEGYHLRQMSAVGTGTDDDDEIRVHRVTLAPRKRRLNQSMHCDNEANGVVVTSGSQVLQDAMRQAEIMPADPGDRSEDEDDDMDIRLSAHQRQRVQVVVTSS